MARDRDVLLYGAKNKLSRDISRCRLTLRNYHIHISSRPLTGELKQFTTAFLKGPSHQIRFARKWYDSLGLG
jgi:hypothetical protein